VTGFVEGSFAYSLLLGMLAAVNPCGFVMLPAYLVSYLSVADETDAGTRLRRALIVGGSLSVGFLGVFVVVGIVSRLFTNWLATNAKYAALLIGLALMVMGIRMLTGWRPRLWIPSLSGASHRHRTRNMIVFGAVYAIASIGCTIGLLTTAILGSFSRHGVVSGVLSVALYGAGMGIFVMALTVSLAFAKDVLIRGGRGAMKAMGAISSILVVLTGIYLTWYWYVAITQRENPGGLVNVVGRWQTNLAETIADIGSLRLFALFTGVIVVSLMVSRRRRKQNELA
jgi:cytochrome c biogenesis protein CcdA